VRVSTPACLVSLLLALASCACKSQEERQLARDVARIAQRVNDVGDAPSNNKVAPLAQLRGEHCEQAAVCELQTLCVQAYSLHVKSVEATTALRQRLRNEREPDELSALEVLQVAEKDLERSRRLIQRCLERQGELERETER
jgi:hypothetical protein